MNNSLNIYQHIFSLLSISVNQMCLPVLINDLWFSEILITFIPPYTVQLSIQSMEYFPAYNRYVYSANYLTCVLRSWCIKSQSLLTWGHFTLISHLNISYRHVSMLVTWCTLNITRYEGDNVQLIYWPCSPQHSIVTFQFENLNKGLNAPIAWNYY